MPIIQYWRAEARGLGVSVQPGITGDTVLKNIK
jgi:hypothetical protein